jgi:hypothetical protein
MTQEENLLSLLKNVEMQSSVKNMDGHDPIYIFDRLASFISLRDIKIRVYDSSGLSSDVSLSPVCAH